MHRHISQTWTDCLFAGSSVSDCFKSNIEARQDIPEFSLQYFFLAYFLLNAHRPQKVRKWTHNVTDGVMDRWRVKQQKIIFSRKLHRGSSNNASFHMVFKHRISLRPIWLQTLVLIDLETCRTLFPSFCAPPSKVTNQHSRCAVWLGLPVEQTSFSRIGRRFRSADLYTIRLAICWLVSVPKFYQGLAVWAHPRQEF